MTEDEVSKMSSSYAPPEDGLLYDYCYDRKKNNWVDWQSTLAKKFSIPSDASFVTIVVPTIDIIRNTWMVDLLIYSIKS